MLTLRRALQHGRAVGVRYYIKTGAGAILGGRKTKEQAEDLLRRLEREGRRNPWTKGQTRLYIEEIKD